MSAVSALLLWPLAACTLGPRIAAHALAAAHRATTRRTPTHEP